MKSKEITKAHISSFQVALFDDVECKQTEDILLACLIKRNVIVIALIYSISHGNFGEIWIQI